MFHRVSTLTVGERSGTPRIFIQGNYLNLAGFGKGKTYEVCMKKGSITLTLRPNGPYVVSGKSNGHSVIDIKNRRLVDAVGPVESVQVYVHTNKITIKPTRVEAKRRSRTRNGLEGSLFSGGGLLILAAHLAGYTPRWAVEHNPQYARVFETNNPQAIMCNMDIADVNINALPEVELLTMGIPCEPFSKARLKTKGVPPEEHKLGDMVFWALKVIDALNPASIVIEEVPEFLKAGAGHILLNALRRMRYNIFSDIMSPHEYGSIMKRDRAVIVAHSGSYTPPAKSEELRSLGEFLDPDEQGEWFTPATKAWVFKHIANQKAAGNNFGSTAVGRTAPYISNIRKRYLAGQGNSPMLEHPTDKDTYRWFTPREIARFFGVPEDFILPKTKTLTGEIIGQGVSVDLFTQVIKGL